MPFFRFLSSRVSFLFFGILFALGFGITFAAWQPVEKGSLEPLYAREWNDISYNASGWARDGNFSNPLSDILLNTEGGVVLGGDRLSPNLKLDVEGRVGAEKYCNQYGEGCFIPHEDIGGGLVTVISNDTLIGLGTEESPLVVSIATVQSRISGICPEGESIRVVNEDGTVLCQLSGEDGLGNHTATEDLNMGFHSIKNLNTPAEPSDAATKSYVDNQAKGAILAGCIMGKDDQVLECWGGATSGNGGSCPFETIKRGSTDTANLLLCFQEIL